ncbi:hypothetical protein HUJ04_012091 [Dendroctonus ponderosae]|nr:hypothetical protein HUJ04_012091 [Dendroctonus ponderosae]
MHIKTLVIIAAVNTICKCCDLEELLGPKQTSLEDATLRSSLVFRGMALPIQDPAFSVFTVFFELITVYKGDGFLKEWRKLNNYFRKINVTFETRTTAADCLDGNKVPRDYVVFASLIQDEIRAGSVAKWDENADLRVWKALACPVQQESSSELAIVCSKNALDSTSSSDIAICSGDCGWLAPGTRSHACCSCSETVTPLDQKSGKFFHPSQDRWQPLADRPTAWRLTPNSYIWIPASLLFSDEECRNIPKDFSLALTMRVPNATLGTVFSVRSRSRQHLYLSLEVTGADLKLIHAAESGTDMVRIPAGLDDGVWHQIAFSLREGRILDVFVDCEWSRTEVLLAHSLEVPDDCDIIVGYLFTGDLEQLSIIKNPHAAHLQCSNTPIPIEDPDVRFTKDGFKLFTRKHAVKSRKHRY